MRSELRCRRRLLVACGVLAGLLAVGISWHEARLRSGAALPAASGTRPAAPAASPLDVALAAPLPTSLSRAADHEQRLADALREWLEDDVPEKREQRIQKMEQEFERGDKTVAGQLDALARLPTELADFAFGLPRFQRWVSDDPGVAVNWIRQHRAVSEARAFAIAERWSVMDRNAFEKYLAQVADPVWEQKLRTAAVYGCLSRDPVDAVSQAEGLEDRTARDGLLELATAHWARDDAVAAAKWASGVSEEQLQQRLLGAVATGYAEKSPEFAARWVAEVLPAGGQLDHSAADLVGIWARHDPAAAGEWVSRFSGGEGRRQALTALLNRWAINDPGAALTWARSQGDAALRAEALGVFEKLSMK